MQSKQLPANCECSFGAFYMLFLLADPLLMLPRRWELIRDSCKKIIYEFMMKGAFPMVLIGREGSSTFMATKNEDLGVFNPENGTQQL